MCPKWRGEVEQEVRVNSRAKIEKIRKEKRSVRGRVIDDWIIDEPTKARTQEDIDREIANLQATGYRLGRVIEVHKKHVFVAEENKEGEPDTGLLWLCTVARRHFQRAHKERNFVVVGDKILFTPDIGVTFDAAGEPLNTNLPRGMIQHTMRRSTCLMRKDPLRDEWDHVMLANVNVLAIVASVLNPEVRWGLIDRILVQAELENIPVVIVLNKVDLLKKTDIASPEFLEKYHKRLKIYRDIGYEIIELCALKPKSTIDAVKCLKRVFRGKIIGLCGHSGVGKSSVVNLMNPEFEQIVDDNPDIFYKGRHTTTYNTLLRLGIGAYAIDTPGVRSFATKVIDPVTLSRCFREFAPYKCKYRECSHVAETECSIKDAVAKGEISTERYRSYLGILKGVSFREGDGFVDEACEIADLKAREFARDFMPEVAREPEEILDAVEVEEPGEGEVTEAAIIPKDLEELIARRKRRVRAKVVKPSGDANA